MGKLGEIADGWKNVFLNELGLGDENVETLATERALICAECPFYARTQKVCAKCGCPVRAKIRSKESICPENKW